MRTRAAKPVSAPTLGPSVDDAAQLALRVLQGQASLREVAQVPDDVMADLYARACTEFERGAYAYASELLAALVLAEPREPVYWQALGGCQQARGQHDSAVRCFAVAALRDLQDPLNHFYAAQSWRALAQTTPALAAIEAALGCAMGRPEHYETFCGALRLRDAIRAQAE